MAKFDSIYNYYENLVFSHIEQQLQDSKFVGDEDFYDDVACIALNQLPPHYLRHTVDAGFYMSSEEHASIAERVENAVTLGIAKVKVFRAGPNRTEEEEMQIQSEINENSKQVAKKTKNLTEALEDIEANAKKS